MFLNNNDCKFIVCFAGNPAKVLRNNIEWFRK